MKLEIEIPHTIAPAESAAIVHAVDRMIAVASHGALKKEAGQFVKDGLVEHLVHASSHVMCFGASDIESKLPHLWHALTRLALACELEAMDNG